MQPTEPPDPVPRAARAAASAARFVSAGLVLTFVAGVGVGRIGEPAGGPAAANAARSRARPRPRPRPARHRPTTSWP